MNQYSEMSVDTRALLYRALINHNNLLKGRKGRLQEFVGGNPVNLADVEDKLNKEITETTNQLTLISKA